MINNTMTEYEKTLMKQGYKMIAGVDEAGRGPVAGPVVAASCILNLEYDYGYINDSKKMTKKQRELAYEKIINNAIWAVSVIDQNEIDRINILEATKKAMTIAINTLEKVEYVLIDAVKLNIDNSMSIIKGDQKSLSIAAASIIAKVTRDKIMEQYDKDYPMYGFKNHKGYLTKKHVSTINEFGPCPIHRKTFKPISLFYNEQSREK